MLAMGTCFTLLALLDGSSTVNPAQSAEKASSSYHLQLHLQLQMAAQLSLVGFLFCANLQDFASHAQCNVQCAMCNVAYS
jgi:hypothetical protein